MYFLKMLGLRRMLVLIASAACLAVLAGCGSTTEVAAVASTANTEEAAAAADDDGDVAEDHDGDAEDEDHGDDDHDDEADDDHGDEDHDDDDHGDEDHDDDHGDEDHDDDHGDEDHDDDEADEDHDDDHGDEDHDDHGDEDHDDHDDHDDEGSGGFDAHVHGVAELFVAWSGGDVVVDLISPAINIIGFEYEPETDEDRATAADRTEALAAPGVIVFNSAAGCTLDGDVEPDLVVDGTHAEVTTSWLFVCDNPDEIKELDTTALFAEFPGLLDIDAQWASESRQSASELSPTSTILRFE